MRSLRVLLIERHQLLARALQRGLKEEGFAVQVASGGEDGDREAMTGDYDAILFDPLLHKESDRSLPRRWRLRGLETPVLVLTTPRHSTAGPDGCEIEADGFLLKPFDLDELFCRLRALTHRTLAGC
jgi:two-component system OmpR family response regulator